MLSGTPDANIRFIELTQLPLKLDLSEGTKGSHYIFFIERIEEIINIQEIKEGRLIGKTKDVLFLLQGDSVDAIPFTALVKRIEIKLNTLEYCNYEK